MTISSSTLHATKQLEKAFLSTILFPCDRIGLAAAFRHWGIPRSNTESARTVFCNLRSVIGIKLITYFAIIVGGLSTYALARFVLGYTRYGAVFSGVIYGVSLFVPLRVYSGNPNEVYAAFLPLCVLLIGLACKGKTSALIILPFVMYTMLSDGKLTGLMAIFYVAFSACWR